MPQNCTWRQLRVVKRINKKCLDASIEKAIVQAVVPGQKNCFSSRCTAAEQANTSSTCYIRCWYDTVLGQNCSNSIYSRSRSKNRGCNNETGIDLRLVQQAWDGAFESDDPGRGGCPGV